MSVIKEISDNLQIGKEKLVKELVQQAIAEGYSAEAILNDALLHGIGIIGEKFKRDEVYVRDVLIATRAMSAGTEILRPMLASSGVKAAGKEDFLKVNEVNGCQLQRDLPREVVII